MPYLILFAGEPGSGKTSIARHIGEKNRKTAIIDLDVSFLDMSGMMQQEKQDVSLRIWEGIVKTCLREGFDVIMEGVLFRNPKHKTRFKSVADECGCGFVFIRLISTPKKLRRNRMRRKIIRATSSEAILQKIEKKKKKLDETIIIESWKKEEIDIDASKSIESVVEDILSNAVVKKHE